MASTPRFSRVVERVGALMCSAVVRHARQPAVVWSVFPVYAAAVAGVEPVVASRRGRTVVEPDRNLSTWLHGVSATSDHAPWVLCAAMLVADGHSPGCQRSHLPSRMSLRCWLLAPPTGATLMLIAGFWVIAMSGLVTARRPSRLRVGRFGRPHGSCAVVSDKTCRRARKGRL